MNTKRLKKYQTNPSLSATDLARLDTWTVEIAAQARGDGREEASGGWRFGRKGSLALHRNTAWYDFEASVGGCGALSLLVHFHGGEQVGADAARAWLNLHAGDGCLGRDGADDEARDEAQLIDDTQHQAYIDALWARAQPLAKTALTYFAGRSLDVAAGDAEAQLRWLPNFRAEEGAVLAAVTNYAGALVALQVTHLKPDGTKSDVQPVRQLYRGLHNWRRRGAFRLGPVGANLVITEGVEDAIATPRAVPSTCMRALARAELAAPSWRPK